jgi:hypothetical protein
MVISSIGGSTVTVLQQQLPAAKFPQQEYPEAARAREEAVPPGESRPTNVENTQTRSVQRQERNEQPERTEAPKVFVNAQGQKTGTIINVTA